MRRTVLLLALITASATAQVGINTNSPTATLDVDGNARIRTISSTSDETTAKTRILATDASGNLEFVNSKLVIQSTLKSYVKGAFSSTADQPLTFTAGSVKIPFNYEDFDENAEYNTSSATFTARSTGIYSIYVQVKATATLGVASNFGVAIVQNGTIVARSGFGNISVLGVAVAPIRQVQTLQKLNENDTITFLLYSDLVNAGLIGNRADSFFTIAQEQ